MSDKIRMSTASSFKDKLLKDRIDEIYEMIQALSDSNQEFIGVLNADRLPAQLEAAKNYWFKDSDRAIRHINYAINNIRSYVIKKDD